MELVSQGRGRNHVIWTSWWTTVRWLVPVIRYLGDPERRGGVIHYNYCCETAALGSESGPSWSWIPSSGLFYVIHQWVLPVPLSFRNSLVRETIRRFNLLGRNLAFGSGGIVEIGTPGSPWWSSRFYCSALNHSDFYENSVLGHPF